MSIITIQCRLVAPEETLRHLWELMAYKNTPLIDELLEQIGKHSEFERWLELGKLPRGLVTSLCNKLKTDPRFDQQSGRFYTSATTLIGYIYESWFALHKQRRYQIAGKERWLKILKSNQELERESNCNLDVILAKAREILTDVNTQSQLSDNQSHKSTKRKKLKKQQKNPESKAKEPRLNKFDILWKAYTDEEDTLSRCAIAYLLKNNCKLSEVAEDLEKLALRQRKTQIQIEKLKKQQKKSRKPRGRDLAGEQWLKILDIATSTISQSEGEAKYWRGNLLRKSKNLPFPIFHQSNNDFTWGKNEGRGKQVVIIALCLLIESGLHRLALLLLEHYQNEQGRLFVYFNGLAEYKFEIQCDRRQLHWFKRFLEDQETNKNQKKKEYSTALFTLRSGHLVWHEGKGNDAPWNKHHLNLHCAVDTRLWTAEGTAQVVNEKVTKLAEKSANPAETDDLNQAHQNQEARLAWIHRPPYRRPSKPQYLGQPSIALGVSLGLNRPATVAVVDVTNSKALKYRSLKQLLGKNYQLINRQRQQLHRHAHERHKAQKQNSPNSYSESELGQHIDRLIAGGIIEIAKTHQASIIVVPKLDNIIETLDSEIQAKAEKKIPGCEKAQHKYAKQYRISIHKWSYARLIEEIQAQAVKVGIAVEFSQPSLRGTPQEKARDLAIAAYQA